MEGGPFEWKALVFVHCLPSTFSSKEDRAFPSSTVYYLKLFSRLEMSSPPLDFPSSSAGGDDRSSQAGGRTPTARNPRGVLGGMSSPALGNNAGTSCNTLGIF